MPDTRPNPPAAPRCARSGSGSSVPLQARGHWFEPSCAHQVRRHMGILSLSAGSQTLALWRTQRSSAAGMARMPSTSRQRRTGTSARSRSASARTGSGCAARSPEVRDKLRAMHAELDAGLQPAAGKTVQAAVDDWLEHGLSGRSPRTIQLYRDGVRPLTDRLGARPLRKLSAADVRSALARLSEQLSTRSLQIAHNCLVRAIRHAEADDLVGRNVAALVRPPAGHEGRPSKALSVEQARGCSGRLQVTRRPVTGPGAPHTRNMPTSCSC